MKKKYAILLLFFALYSCVSNKNNTTVTGVEQNKIPNYVVAPSSYKPSNTLYFDLIHTKLDVSFDWEKAHLLGKAELTVSPHAYPQNSIDLDAKGFDVRSINIEKLNATNYSREISFEYDSEKIHIVFGQKIEFNDTLIISIDYVAKPNELEVGGSTAISSDKGLYFINPNGTEPFMPKQIWTQGETEASSCWFPTLDAPNQKTTSEISITVENKYKTLSNGVLTSSEIVANGKRRDTWVQNKKHAPYLVMMAVGEFAEVKDAWRGKEVNYYVESEYEDMAKPVFGNTPEMLSFYSDLLGVEYPWDKYSQIVIRDYVSGAMENTSAVTFLELLNVDSIEINDRNWDFIVAHELFHHWFGDLVTCESWSNLSLNESFANYSEYLWIKHKYGEEEAEQHIAADLSNYLMEAHSKRVPIVRFHYDDKEDMFDRHSYEKGALVLHMLRNHLGDDVFFKSLNYYLTSKKYQTAEMHDLRLVFETISGQDLNWFFNQWFMEAGHPELVINGQLVNGDLEVSVEQVQNLEYNPEYRLLLEVLLKFEDSEKMVRYWIESKDTSFSIPLNGELLQYYVVDPNYILLADIKETKSNTYWEKELDADFSYHSQNRVMDFLFPKSIVETKKQKDLAIQLLSSKFKNVRARAVGVLNKSKEADVLSALLTLFDTEDDPNVLRWVISNLGGLKRDSLQSEFISKLQFPSYLVKAELINNINNKQVIDSLFERHKDYTNYYISTAFINYFTNNNIEDKLAWGLDAFEKQKLSRKNYFVSGLIKYVTKQDENGQLKAVEYFNNRCLNSTISSTKTSAYKALCLLNEKIDTNSARKNILEKEISKKQKDKYLEVEDKYLQKK